MPVSMADIAAHAGVSASTVSYALSGKKPVSPEALRRVQRAVEELGYHRNAAARALASRRSRRIALVVPPLASGLVATQLEFVVGVAEEASRHDYDMLLSTSRNAQVTLLRLVRESVVDGLVLMEVRLDDPRVALLRELDASYVLIGRPRDSSGVAYVDADTESMVRRALEYLHGLGHREIAFVNLPCDLLDHGYAPAVRAEEAYRRACENLGLEPEHRCCGTTTDATVSCVEALLATRPTVTAIVSNNDDALAGLMATLERTGRRIPEDVSVLGILGPTKAAQLTRPALTALELPTAAMATAAARTLIERLEGGRPADPAGVLFDPPLIERASCAPPA